MLVVKYAVVLSLMNLIAVIDFIVLFSLHHTYLSYLLPYLIVIHA